MAKQMIEIDVPDGMQVSEIKEITATGYAVHLAPKPKTKWRPPTKLDLLGVDSIKGRVRNDKGDLWQLGYIAAVTTGLSTKYITDDWGVVRFAEIEVPIDEVPPREAWARYDKDNDLDPWGFTFPDAEQAECHHYEVVHMIEVRQPHASPSA